MSSSSAQGVGSYAHRIVTDHWRDTLQLDGDYEDYTFYELGGTSLTAAQLVLALGRELGCRISVQAVADNPTLRQFRAHVLTIAAEAGRDM
ncbi:acyl carrier protein [Streptomyces sp. NPDC047043]|uniref:acyl carrier protein n=1 Tax=Streptomyces sp. NPDC047043 TaxID=3154497 RepID=UPI0034043734